MKRNLCILDLDFLHEISVHELLTAAFYIDVFGIAGIFHVPAKNNGSILLIKFHHEADTVCLLACHKG